jgi:hypothetical protein
MRYSVDIFIVEDLKPSQIIYSEKIAWYHGQSAIIQHPAFVAKHPVDGGFVYVGRVCSLDVKPPQLPR